VLSFGSSLDDCSEQHNLRVVRPLYLVQCCSGRHSDILRDLQEQLQVSTVEGPVEDGQLSLAIVSFGWYECMLRCGLERFVSKR